jgi:molecular chaperone HscC
MIIGIDLGTTNSLVAAWQDGASSIIPNALGHVMTPSVVGLDDNGEVLVGMAARERLLTHPHITAAAFKRYMGSEHVVKFGKQSFRPEELSALLLRSLKSDAEAHLGAEVKEAIITVPAYFNDAQRKATRAAGELAGLKVERLLNEPTAAALAYGLHQSHAEKKILIFDLGGGTFDVSILEMFDGIMEIRASAGDNFLGGEDFTDAIARAFLDRHEINKESRSPRELAAIMAISERAKRSLTGGDATTMEIRDGEQTLTWEIEPDEFEQLARPLLKRLMTPVERALRDSSIRTGEIDEIVLVGGATRMQILRKSAARMFGKLPLAHINPDEIVALGAAVQAGLKIRDAALDEVVLTDVCPYTLGTEVGHRGENGRIEYGLFAPILERNTVIPASRVERFYTLRDNQKKISVDVYQGESRLVQNNISLGEFTINVPKAPAGQEAVDIRFSYDINGLLEVEATAVSTQESKSIVIERTPGSLSEKEMRKSMEKLSDLKIHPRDQAENRALMARAERLYEEFLGEKRELIGRHITHFEGLLATQDPFRIRDGRKALEEALNEIDGTPAF